MFSKVVMASPYILTNGDFQFVNTARQDFRCYVAFLNPIAIATTWSDLSLDDQGNWLPPPNVDTVAARIAPYAPTANMGSNRIGFTQEALYFDGSRSSQRFDLPVVDYTWGWSGYATPVYYAGNSQLSLVWYEPGIYQVSLTVTDIYGSVTTGIRQVMVYQDREHGLPGVMSLSGLSGSLSSGGWQCQMTTLNAQVTLYPPDMLPIGTYQPIVILIETIFEPVPGYRINRTIGPHGQFAPGYPYQDPRIFFDGYVQSGSVHQDVNQDTLSFACVGPQMILNEVKTHQLGYYNTNYATTNGLIPTSCNPSFAGQGFLVVGLMSVDVIHSLLEYHTNIGQFHDVHCWNANIPTQAYNPGAADADATYNLIYTSISANEGTVWSNLQDITTNEWAQVYCERDGSIRIGPQINYRGNEYWNIPTLLGGTAAPALINFVQDLGYSVGSHLPTMTNNIPVLPAMPMPIQFVHPWGAQPNPPQVSVPFQTTVPYGVQLIQIALSGPPLLCVFSDTPIYDEAATVPVDDPSLYPWTTANWPQDLAVYPVSFDIQENYTGRTSLVKLIGTLANANTIWSSWYPQNTFQPVGDGTQNVVTANIPAGNWIVNQQILLPDITKAQNRTLLWNWWWEIARRVYYAQNNEFGCVITLGMFTAASLGDIVGVTRKNITLGPQWQEKPFVVQQIDYALDMTARTWTTTITTIEVTSAQLTPIQPPPGSIPMGQ